MLTKLRKGSCYCIYADTRFLSTQCKVFLAVDLSRWKRALVLEARNRYTQETLVPQKKPFERHNTK